MVLYYYTDLVGGRYLCLPIYVILSISHSPWYDRRRRVTRRREFNFNFKDVCTAAGGYTHRIIWVGTYVYIYVYTGILFGLYRKFRFIYSRDDRFELGESHPYLIEPPRRCDFRIDSRQINYYVVSSRVVCLV